MVLLCGFTEGALPELAVKLERAVGLRLELHDSEMRGGDYYRYEGDGEQIILQSNRDNGDIAEEDFPEIPILLYIDSQMRTQEQFSRLLGPKVQLLRF
jgi:hypothetical protein